MTTNFSDTPNPADIESPMFAPVPAWERNKKRRAFGRSAPASTMAAEERSFAPADEVTPRLDPRPLETETAFAGTPTYASSATVKRNNVAPIALAAGVVLIGGLAAAGWYATQPHGAGVAQLTPGQATTTTTTTNAAPAADAAPAPRQLAVQDTLPPVAPPAPKAPKAAVTHTTTTTTMAHRAPAPRPVSRSVEASGVNASAIAPAPAPQAAPPQAPLVLTPAPTQSVTPPVETPAAPAPAPTETPPQ